MERLVRAAEMRETTMSQLLQEYAEQSLLIDERLVRMCNDGQFGDEPLSQVLKDYYLRDIARQFAEARDADDYERAAEDLREWQENRLC